MFRTALVVTLLTAAHPARAESDSTVTLQPMMLALPMIDSTIEYQPTHHIGIAARAGIGHVFLPLISANMYELGGAANVYLTRPFSGWHLGSELYWLWGVASSSTLSIMSTSDERIASLYGGYKWIGWRGLTAVVQLGVGRMDTKSNCNCMTDVPASQIIPTAHASVGWTF
jgi:hypothetical protein